MNDNFYLIDTNSNEYIPIIKFSFNNNYEPFVSNSCEINLTISNSVFYSNNNTWIMNWNKKNYDSINYFKKDIAKDLVITELRNNREILLYSVIVSSISSYDEDITEMTINCDSYKISNDIKNSISIIRNIKINKILG
jgi:hypothetical protein